MIQSIAYAYAFSTNTSLAALEYSYLTNKNFSILHKVSTSVSRASKLTLTRFRASQPVELKSPPTGLKRYLKQSVQNFAYLHASHVLMYCFHFARSSFVWLNFQYAFPVHNHRNYLVAYD